MNWRIRDLVNLAVALMLAARPAAAQQPTLATVLERAGAYVTEFQRQLSGIVAEERYTQEITSFSKRGGCRPAATYQSTLNCRGQLVVPIRADLRSDLLLVKPMGATDWAQFRDVFEADGRPVRDRADRLTRLFLNESPFGADPDRPDPRRERAVQHRRHHAEYQRARLRAAVPRCRRTRRVSSSTATKDRVPATFTSDDAPTGAFRVSTDVWIVEYQRDAGRHDDPDAERKDLPSRGRFWIEPRPDAS